MIDPRLLQELVAFAKTGTLSQTAEELHLTQPTVTRGMQKLEQELGVALFNRTGNNKISLNTTGQLAAKEASRLLDMEDELTEKVRNFAESQTRFLVGSDAPGPLLLSERIENKLPVKVKLDQNLLAEDELLPAVESYRYQLVFSSHEYQTDLCESRYIGYEQLFLMCDKNSDLAKKGSVTFQELAGVSFLVLQGIGPWKQIKESAIPNAHFLYQDDLSSLTELTKYSQLPVFRSNLSFPSHPENDDRVPVRIDDPKNRLDFYAIYRKDQKKMVMPLLELLSKNWPEDFPY
ncbi:LysR family transcriptional regulator [Lactobacillus nasalidis]|uniref:LysR family transcriptional regulator n=1 Tax=Lactobacillus nasalidis TaxID=2797258 RepID=A0ABQ3W5B7_9LACO|nr:LysR family transcriptional regulator [Lactobacillus nasalidis]GHV97477.1 LysR family transcriptional regulator [Lactobacillus nasalidis]GHW00287.1 LysR family transcriptional regulator [Lactobacillus nasalidis]GHW01183.1 LysR family transcriptional regulator [Lactobacillus nasalidis]